MEHQTNKKRDYTSGMKKVSLNAVFVSEAPPHPGKVFKEFISKIKFPANYIADCLGVTRTSFYEFLNCKSGISPEMALRLAKVTGIDARIWWKINCDWQFWASITKSSETDRIKVGIQNPEDFPGKEVMVDEIESNALNKNINNFEASWAGNSFGCIK